MRVPHKAARGIVALAAAGLVLQMGGTAFADGWVTAQANDPQAPSIANSNANAVFPTNKQNEPTIAVTPQEAGDRILLAGSNDEQSQPACGPGTVRGSAALPNDCSFVPGVGTSGIYRSLDNGAHWDNLGLLDDQASWKNGDFVSDGDPVIVFGPKPKAGGGFDWNSGARAYYATLASYKPGKSPFPPNKAPEFIAVSYSDDNGTTWSSPVLATTKNNPVDFNDKEWIAVDTNATSPYFGRVYASWTSFRQNTSEPVETSYSADGGLTWTAPKQVSPAANTAKKGRQGSVPAVGPDGTVYIAFEQGPAQTVVVSSDGGRSWTRPATAAAVVDIEDPIPGANFRTASFPSLAVGPKTLTNPNGTVYIAWADRTADGGRIKVVSSSDRAKTWSAPVTVSLPEDGYAFFPGIAVAPNGRVDVGYQALLTDHPTTFGTGNALVTSYYVSAQPGAAFGSSVDVSPPSDPAAGAQNNLQRQFWGDYNQMVSSNDRAWFIATASLNGVGCPAVDAYQKYLKDNGLVTRGDMADRIQSRLGADPYAQDPSVKPAPQLACPPPLEGTAKFGNTDALVSVIAP